MGFGRDLLEEEPREPRVIAPPVVAIELGPAVLGRQLVVERPHREVRMARRQPRYPDGERDDALDALRPGCGQADRAPHPVPTQPDEDGPVGVRGVQDRQDVTLIRSSAYAAGSVGRSAAVAAVEGNGAVVPAQEGIWAFTGEQRMIGVDGEG
jgi:hypothetical protein